MIYDEMLPRVIGLLAFFDESPLWLGATITSIAPHINHLVAVDGRYALYPHDAYLSRQDQAEAIVEICQAAKIGLTLHRPSQAWMGNEVEKRSHMFRLGELEAEPNHDWYFVIDADEVVDRCPYNLCVELADTEYDVAEVRIWERGDPYRNPARLEHEQQVALPQDSSFPTPALFRAIPGLHVEGMHARYVLPDGRRLWDAKDPQAAEPTLMLSELILDHRTNYRPKQRHEDGQAYYKLRERNEIEVG